MPINHLFAQLRTLRMRLMLWNAGAVAATGLLILLAVWVRVRATLIDDLDEVLREDVKEIRLTLDGNQPYAWPVIQQELDRKAEGHEFHKWFVQFYDAQGNPAWASQNTPELPPLTSEQKRTAAFTIDPYRLSYTSFAKSLPERAAVCVGCSQAYVARDMATIDRHVISAGLVVLLVSPLVGHLLTSRTIRPLAQMIRTTERLHPGEFGERLPIRGTGDELDSLAHTINGLLDRIATYLQQEHDFLANAAHDLRTPLAAIRSSVEVALGVDRTDEEYREILGLVVEQCSALQTLVNQLLLLAETDADRLQPGTDPVPLDHIVERVAAMFDGVADDHGIELYVGQVAPIAVAGNLHHLRQVISNLLDNAIKFTAARAIGEDAAEQAAMPRGRVTIELTRDDQQHLAFLRVSDNGIGISPSDLPHVFDRFYRADKARARDTVAGGTGLGLSICKAIVESHGGEIQVTSQRGVGTTFTVSLPLAPTADAAQSAVGESHDSVLHL